jgi:hypothetical protein
MNPLSFMAAPKKTTTKKSSAAKAASSSSSSNVAVAELPKSSASSSTKSTTGQTQICAKVDVGFGNNLFIRGSGAGLSWNVGQKMTWANGTWTWSTTSSQSFEFKVLINDQTWSTGENYTTKAGQKVSFTPQF